jgi:hypothetical protein
VAINNNIAPGMKAAFALLQDLSIMLVVIDFLNNKYIAIGYLLIFFSFSNKSMQMQLLLIPLQ